MRTLALQEQVTEQLNASHAQLLKAAVELYRGDLLEGWYQDWCLFERERLQNLNLLILDKLIAYSEDQHQYEAGLEFGDRILRLDRAHERTYQRMMRLHHLAGDRAGALRIYQRCANALQEELGVKPGLRTTQLLEQIRADCSPGLQLVGSQEGQHRNEQATEPDTISTILARVRRLLSILSDTQSRIEREVQAIDRVMPREVPILPKRRVNEK